MKYVTIEEIEAAARALPPIVRRTPLWPYASDPSEIGRERLFLKLENLQAIGAYKGARRLYYGRGDARSRSSGLAVSSSPHRETSHKLSHWRESILAFEHGSSC